MKKIIIGVVAASILCFMFVSTVRWAMSDILGVWHKFPRANNRVRNYRNLLAQIHNKAPDMTFDQYKEFERLRIRYEISFLDVLSQMLTELSKRNQFHDGVKTKTMEVDKHWVGDIPDV